MTASARRLQIDSGTDSGGTGPAGFAQMAASAELLGYDGIVATETAHDPVVGLSAASVATSSIQLTTGVLIAFARNPMTVAMQAADLQELSRGRFVLGMGSQVRPHIERRFSMPWSKPAARMREFVSALHAIWNSFETGERLRFHGEFYRHTLMTPAFSPGGLPHGRPEVWIAGVGPAMTRAAGAVADGFMAHPFTTASYLREVTAPILAAGAGETGRDPSQIGVRVAPLAAVGRDGSELEDAIRQTRKRIAFYGSTPAYRGVLEHHGWGELADRLHAGSLRGEWDDLADLISDEVLTEFAVIGTPEQVADQTVSRFADQMTRLTFTSPAPPTDELPSALIAAIRARSEV